MNGWLDELMDGWVDCMNLTDCDVVCCCCVVVTNSLCL